VLWARLGSGRPKVPLIVALQSTVICLVALVAVLPKNVAGGWLLAASVVLARLAISGVVTLRSTVWTLNYPNLVRARLVGRLILFATIVMMVMSLGAGSLLDKYPGSFRILYPLGALIAVFGARAFSKLPIVDEEEHLREEQSADTGHGTGAPAGVTRAWAVLRDDPLYRDYLGCQFLLGVGNMMVEAPLIYVVTKQFEASYVVSVSMLLVIPLAVQMLTITPWTHIMDRVHIAQFRVWQSAFFSVSLALTGLSVWMQSLGLLAVARVLYGMARAGGGVAWTIGHNDFASRQMATLYMGIHVTLTGVRGAVAPFLGMLLFLGWGRSVGPLSLPHFSGIGAWVWAVSVACSIASGVGFRRLRRRIPGPRQMTAAV